VIDLDSAICFVQAPAAGRALAARLRSQQPLFTCVIGSTDTALVPGVSAAGASTELIPFTAAADAEFLAYGAARCIAGVPCNPLGPPGPAVITRAALELAGLPHLIVSAGCHVLPDAPYVEVGTQPGGLISEGEAVPDALKLFVRGRELGAELATSHPYLVIGESVPGGTTTALALLLALGFAADGRVSSSMAANAHGLKSRIAHAALERLVDAPREHPMQLVRTLGDPMQAVVAGMVAGALDASETVLLAGGTQMIAVLALVRALVALGECPDPAGRVAVVTTRWVAEDPTADAPGLAQEVGPEPLLATALSFARSAHAGLRRYEEFLVKEGVGAGGAAVVAALAAEVSCEELLAKIEAICDGLATAPEVLHV
jgi:uncharacterized protein (TIGR00303 family)